MKNLNILSGTRCYLIGPMEFEDGTKWREHVQNELSSLNINFFNPYHKPFLDDIPEDDAARKDLHRWRSNGHFDMVSQQMKAVRGFDLRLCDICDWFIARISPNVPTWGSMEEIVTVIRQKKPLFLVINDPDGVKACPLWFFGVLPYKYIYNNIEDALDTIRNIDSGVIKMSSDRWKLLKKEYR
jgi:hypothetical protein